MFLYALNLLCLTNPFLKSFDMYWYIVHYINIMMELGTFIQKLFTSILLSQRLGL